MDPKRGDNATTVKSFASFLLFHKYMKLSVDVLGDLLILFPLFGRMILQRTVATSV